MILEDTTKPTATITLTIDELKTISRAHGCMMSYHAADYDATRYKEHKRLQACIDSVIRTLAC